MSMTTRLRSKKEGEVSKIDENRKFGIGEEF